MHQANLAREVLYTASKQSNYHHELQIILAKRLNMALDLQLPLCSENLYFNRSDQTK
jgi:hypothetical protein